MHSLLTAENLVTTPITDGDAGIVLKPDGSFKIFSTGKVDPNNLSEEQLQQGEKLAALSLALQIPAVMDILIQMLNDPRVVGENVISLPKN